MQRPSGPTGHSLPSVAEKDPRRTARTRRSDKARRARFRDAAAFAYAMDLPLNTALTITWPALLTAGEHSEGHCLGRGEQDRERYVRKELARLCRNEGLPFAALWGRDIGRKMGAHIHFSMFWPHYRIARLVALLERITGSSAAFVLKPYTADTVARSVCGGWQIDMNNRPDSKASALDWVDYIATQHAKHPAPPEIDGKAFGISEAIGNAAQARARPMLEAREALYAWVSAAACLRAPEDAVTQIDPTPQPDPQPDPRAEPATEPATESATEPGAPCPSHPPPTSQPAEPGAAEPTIAGAAKRSPSPFAPHAAPAPSRIRNRRRDEIPRKSAGPGPPRAPPHAADQTPRPHSPSCGGRLAKPQD
ncbi:MAG: hypothetical protein ACJAVS_002511 [Paracoccaceae bacterium]|jgi:hypothetical protein